MSDEDFTLPDEINRLEGYRFQKSSIAPTIVRCKTCNLLIPKKNDYIGFFCPVCDNWNEYPK